MGLMVFYLKQKMLVTFQKKIDMLYENKTLREQLVSNASEYAYKMYDYDKHFDRLEEIFDSL